MRHVIAALPLFAALVALGCGSSDAAGGGGEGGGAGTTSSASRASSGGGQPAGPTSTTGGHAGGGQGGAASGSATFHPTVIGLDAPDVTNSMRGQYNWLGVAPYPAGWKDVDSYQRYNWAQIESSAGRYDFSRIDQEIADAKQRNGRFGMRIMPLCQGCGDHMYQGANTSIPDDLADATNALIGHAPGESDLYVLPDWNSSAYLDRLDAIVNAVAARYHDEPTFAWVDVFSYGNWGEWHLYPFSQPGGPYDSSAQRPITDANAARIVQHAATAFSNKLLVLNVDNAAADATAIAITSPSIGFRVDCLGADGLGGGSVIDGIPGAADVWKRAPFITEWCQVNIGDSMPLNDLFVQGEQQVRDYHISMVSSGNFQMNPTPGAEMDAFRKANVEAGYRLRVDSMTVTLTPDGAAHVETTWQNDGVAPTYLPWKVTLVLRGAASVEGGLAVDLKTVLPGSGTTATDDLQLGALASGTYDVVLRVDDAQGVSGPMQLAMEGQNTAGEYDLGSIAVP